MFGLMIGFMLIIGLGIVFLGFSRGDDAGPGPTFGNWWPGMWGMGPFVMIFPFLGLVMMLLMFFFGGMGRRGGPLGRGGPMGWMSGHHHDPQSRSQGLGDEPQDTCPSCGAPFQADWKVCPHCGQEFKK